MKRLEYSDTQVCTTCKEEKLLSSFWKAGTPRKDGSYRYRTECIECGTASRLDHYHNKGGKEKQQQRSFKNNLKKYGITPQEYKHMFELQQGRCKVCNSKEPSKLRPTYNLFVDHDHKTKKVRGLLCHHCNVGLGHFKDDSKLLKKAIEYLNENRS